MPPKKSIGCGEMFSNDPCRIGWLIHFWISRPPKIQTGPFFDWSLGFPGVTRLSMQMASMHLRLGGWIGCVSRSRYPYPWRKGFKNTAFHQLWRHPVNFAMCWNPSAVLFRQAGCWLRPARTSSLLENLTELFLDPWQFAAVLVDWTRFGGYILELL